VKSRTLIAVILTLPALGTRALAGEDAPLRYRGEYTYGHEVEIFCPQINSRCFWLSPETHSDLRDELRALVSSPDRAPYLPQCIVVEGSLDTTAPRTGFAADYDGLVTVTHVFGKCSEIQTITQGDLQHHRWLLESIDGTEPSAGEQLPELDFGARMHVSGNLGCRSFSATAELRGPYLAFSDIRPQPLQCSGSSAAVERVMLELLREESVVAIDAEHHLILSRNGTELRFRLEDWK
jgi:heat shock protein HslJ